MTIEDENKFNFYVEGRIEDLRNSEDWSNGKIAFHLRRVAQELSPRKPRVKKIIIPKEEMNKILDKMLDEHEELTKKTKGLTCPVCNTVQGESYEGFKEFYCSHTTEIIDNKLKSSSPFHGSGNVKADFNKGESN